ncbi:MAG: NADP-dependent oxidoreductase [Rhodovibrionaceae bacterium]|nr:NADP-dependent oxidoreductase [Rhodovibrionaceae bacterium]
MSGTNRCIVLDARPTQGVSEALFRLEDVPRGEPADGELLIRVVYLSLDPAMRGWIADAPNYREPVPLGAVMPGFTVGEVVVSHHDGYAPGDIVLGRQGWQEWAISDGSDIDRKIAPGVAPLTASLHILGMTGLTGYLGLTEVGRPREGETVVVSTAAGAVGSVVGQVAKILGCRAVGIAGGEEKRRACLDEFGFDAAIDYRGSGDLSAAVAEAAPEGVDVFFDNTGGPIADAVMDHINIGARIVVCGTIGIEGHETGPRPNRQLLINRARMEGFLVLDHFDRLEESVRRLGIWLREGRLAYREDITDGLEQAPVALVRMLAGENRGKTIVRVGPEPA